ncbi:MAG: DUF423 domain-containing protein [Chitinophagaceae bacterium]
MHRGFLFCAAILGALAVVAGAFAAHGLKTLVTADTLNIFQTGVRYQFYHVFGLMSVGIIYGTYPGKSLKRAGLFFILGIFLFSGSLYLMTYFRAVSLPFPPYLGIITPIGGAFFIAGWISLAWGIRKH